MRANSSTTHIGYCVIWLCILQHHLVDGARILLTPFPWGSHVAKMMAIGNQLTANGHDVYILLPPVYPDIQSIKQSKVTVVEYVKKESDFFDMPSNMTDRQFYTFISRTEVASIRWRSEGYVELCTNVLSDQDLFMRLTHLNLDLGIVDLFPRSRCYLILMYRLNIPYISHTTIYEPWLFRSPAIPSYVPLSMTSDYSNRMNFKERLVNTWSLLDWTISPRVPALDDRLVYTYAPEKPRVSLDFLATRSLMWFFGTDDAIDYPQVMMPNAINVGGLTTKPPHQISPELVNFMYKSSDAVIVVSFGSNDMLPPGVCAIIMEALRQVTNARFIWRYLQEYPKSIPSHIKLMRWIPQNDLLGHPKVKLFITHGGANGQFEALYNSVPMITMPMFADQPYNARRAEVKGISLTVNIRELKADILVSSIREILFNNSYQENIDRLSQLYRSRPMTPTQRAAYWVDHILEFGGDHMHSSALDMPWYQYLMLDILTLVLLSLSIIVLITQKGIYIFFRC